MSTRSLGGEKQPMVVEPTLVKDPTSPLQLAPAVIVTRPDERGAQAGTLLSGSSEGSGKRVV